MRRVIIALAMLLSAGACATGADGGTNTTGRQTPTTTTTAAATTTTTAQVTTTTEVLECPRELGIRTDADGSPRRLLPGECYYHQHFDAASFEFAFEAEEWGLVVSGNKILSMGDDRDRADVQAVTFITFVTDSAPEIIDRLATDDDVELISEAAGEFAGLEATILDLIVPESPMRPGAPFPCNGPVFADEQINGRLISAFLIGCSENRVWLIDVAGATLVIHVGNITGSIGDVATLEEISEQVELFEAGTTICTVDQPCDD